MYKKLLALIVISFIGSTAYAIDIPPEPVPSDTTRPTVVITTPTPNVNTPYIVTAVFSEDVTGFDVSDIENIGGAALNISALSLVGAHTYSFTVSGPDGSHRVQIKEGATQDAAGNTSLVSNELAVNYDTTPPVVVVSNGPSNGSETNRPVIFEFSSDDSAATYECAFVSGTSLGDSPTFLPCPASPLSFDPGLTTDGIYTFAVRGLDELGNTSTPTVGEGTLITFTYDTDTPDVQIVTPVPTPSSAAPVLVISSSEPVTLEFFGPCGIPSPLTIPAGVHTLTFPALPPGMYSTRPQFTEGLGVEQVPILVGDYVKGVPEGSDYSHMCVFNAKDTAGNNVFLSIATFVIEPSVGGGGGGNGPLSSVTSNSGSTSSTVTMEPSGPQPGEGNRVLSGQSTPPSDAPQFANSGTGSSAGGTTSGSQVQDKPKPKNVAKSIKKPKPVARKPKEVPPPQTPNPTPAQSQTASASQSADGLWSWLGYFFGF